MHFNLMEKSKQKLNILKSSKFIFKFIYILKIYMKIDERNINCSYNSQNTAFYLFHYFIQKQHPKRQ